MSSSPAPDQNEKQTAQERPSHGRSGTGSSSALNAWIDDMRRAEQSKEGGERRHKPGESPQGRAGDRAVGGPGRG
jgi:hypothetical protein